MIHYSSFSFLVRILLPTYSLLRYSLCCFLKTITFRCYSKKGEKITYQHQEFAIVTATLHQPFTAMAIIHRQIKLPRNQINLECTSLRWSCLVRQLVGFCMYLFYPTIDDFFVILHHHEAKPFVLILYFSALFSTFFGGMIHDHWPIDHN